MKAIIMAGGKGTRLRPICDTMPKPMARLMGRPLLEHTIALLEENGFTELCATLGHMPQSIISHFGDGSQMGVSLEYRIEEQPLGTAGGVLACRDFYGDEDFLVISGDAACDFNLRNLYSQHKSRGADLTMAVFPHEEPLLYGTVVTDSEYNILSFIEKPQWERVVTDYVNTGIYVISPHVMELVPQDKPFDFAKDLFPLMAKKGMSMTAVPMEGYWCDIGDAKSYLRCSMDVLAGRLHLSKQSCGLMPEAIAESGVLLVPPALVCPGAKIGHDAVIVGSVIHPGSIIGAHSRIVESVVDGAVIGEACIINSTVVTQGARVSPQTVTCAGEVIAPPHAQKPPAPVAKGGSERRASGLCRELSCESRAKLMRQMSCHLWEAGADFQDGITLKDGKCKVRISPISDESAISIEAIGGREKDRIALCEKYSALAESLGCRGKDL